MAHHSPSFYGSSLTPSFYDSSPTFLVWLITQDTLFWEGMWAEAGLPANVFKRCLAGMPIPTSSKWEILNLCTDLFLQLLELPTSTPGLSASMIEEFFKRTHELLRGTIDVDRPQALQSHIILHDLT